MMTESTQFELATLLAMTGTTLESPYMVSESEREGERGRERERERERERYRLYTCMALSLYRTPYKMFVEEKKIQITRNKG